MAKNYWAELIKKACDADWRCVSPLPADMITVGYAEMCWFSGLLEEEEGEGE